jgi:hypothetical protein
MDPNHIQNNISHFFHIIHNTSVYGTYLQERPWSTFYIFQLYLFYSLYCKKNITSPAGCSDIKFKSLLYKAFAASQVESFIYLPRTP